ncbi:uncharacterized protein LOC122499211 [Leptopilina heterotoma]|uniref:uncharacterized protein LOC122499211 n=1 Tax=Leptopilina heterotoma TaxID=63436 RepID=UPI001CA81795|nr:uncharacterized protein LOC122499211 [Leptopilina heterotoma]
MHHADALITDFSDLKKEERYQNLAKSLKVTRLITNAKSQLIPWSSCSSINGDPSDANYTLASQFSKTGREIITSSRNLKNLIHKRSCYSPMATSSVKRFCVNEKNSNDKEIMPPPSSYGIRTPLKRTASADPPQERSKFSRQSTHDNNHFSEEKQTTHFDLNSSEDFSEDHVGGPSDSQKEKNSDRHFYRWRVFLNDRGELLIKGLLNNEIWARSKPVAEMLSPTKLKSKYQHTYYLNGNIIDEKNELPKYIYQKFYNGFLDDWRNVHVIWKNYVAQGCSENFRWPMDVNYSDDDLNSEITDITHMQKTAKKFRSFGYSSDFPHERETTKTIDKARKNQSIGNNFTVITEEFSEKENRSLHESRNQTNMTMDTSCSGKLYTALNYAISLKDIIFENKLTFITQNLLHEKCPKEYVQCVSRTIRDLNNILSVKIGDQDENTLKKFMDNLHTKDSENFTPASCLGQDDDYTSRLDECEANSEKLTKNSSNDINEKLMRQITTDKIVQENDTEGLSKNKNKEYALNSNVEKNLNLNFNAKTKTQETDSESEIYAGVPKISEKILQSKIYHKRQRKIDTNGKSRIRSTNKESKNDLHYDSSVSILEDEFHKNTTDNERIVRVDSKNSTTGNHSKVDDFLKERRADPLRENHVIDDNKSSSKIPLFFKLPNTNNDNKKSIVNKENIDDDNIFQRRDINDYPDSTQRKEIQNQKPIITNTENVNFHNFKKPQNPTIEQNPHVLKQSQVRQNQEEKIGEIGKNSSQDTFGSVENPKIFTNWIPLVTFVGNKCQLVFEGTLLNSVGQLMKKKLTKSQVVKRISTSTVETSDHQFYKLLGEISVKKHEAEETPQRSLKKGRPPKRLQTRTTRKRTKIIATTKTSPNVVESITEDSDESFAIKVNKTKAGFSTPVKKSLEGLRNSSFAVDQPDELLGKQVFAKWSDNNYYAGHVMDTNKTKYKVNFLDGKSKQLIAEFIIPISETFGNGLSVYTLTKDGDYGPCGMIVDIVETNNKVSYVIEPDEGKKITVQIKDIFLTPDQAQVLKEEVWSEQKSLPSTPHSITQVTLDNMVDGKRCSRRNTSTAPTPKSKKSLTNLINKTTEDEPFVSGVASKSKEAEKDKDVDKDGKTSDSNCSIIDENGVHGVQKEIPGTANEQITTKGPQSRIKGKQRNRKKSDDQETIDLLGPIPEANSKIFDGMSFVLTCASVESIDRYNVDNGTDSNSSEVGTENEEVWNGRPFVRERLEQQIVAGGGKVYESFDLIPVSEYESTKLITNLPNLTAKSLLCLSVGISASNHMWVIRSCQNNKPVNPSEEKLPAGWSIDRRSYVEMFNRRDQKPLMHTIVVIPYQEECDKEFVSFWSRICENAGGNVRVVDNLLIIYVYFRSFREMFMKQRLIFPANLKKLYFWDYLCLF